jgi:hypothetical protein
VTIFMKRDLNAKAKMKSSYTLGCASQFRSFISFYEPAFFSYDLLG